MKSTTIGQLQESLEVTYPEAFGLIKILLKYDLVEVEKPKRPEGFKGKIANVYRFKSGFGEKLEKHLMEAIENE